MSNNGNLSVSVSFIDTLHNIGILSDEDFDRMLDYLYLTYGEYYDGFFECDDCL